MKNSLRLVSLVLLFSVSSSFAVAEEQQLIQIRIYKLLSKQKADDFDRMMKAAIPLLEEAGAEQIGVFERQNADVSDEEWRFVIVPYKSGDAFLNFAKRFQLNPEFGAIAKDYLQTEKSDPAYSRIESSLLRSFTGMPRLKVPGSGEGKKRIFELRIYESHSELKGKAKIKMFNEGEIQLFEKVGLDAVFYGEAVIANNLPNLTYMLVHDDEAAQKASWKRFIEHPEWAEMKAIEEYKDTVSKIVKHMLVATDYSQIK